MQCFLTLQSITAIQSAIYSFADEAERAVDHARGEVADLIGARRMRYISQAAGSESDNWALKATAEAYAAKESTSSHQPSSIMQFFTQHSGLRSMALR